MKIKIHNINPFVKSITDGKFRAFGVFTDLGVLVGPKGIVVVCSEGVHWKFDTPDETFTLYLEPDTKGCFSVMATHTTKCTIQNLMDTEFEEKTLSEFIRDMGPNHRLEENYYKVMQSIDLIGLNALDFRRERA